ncbi:MAG: hypothetical protein IJX71_05265, partial [Oscillospiraceae bacterium]|nr:hypothetical protein [Oscillospiraceae bacterium]
MTCEIIATGSRGNAVLLNGRYLFDCGVPFATLKPYIKDLAVVFLTHIHGDHFSRQTIRKIHVSRPAVRFVCSRNLLVPLCAEIGVKLENVVLVTPENGVQLHWGFESIRIECFDLIHNVENVGYAVEVTGGEEPGRAMYATDTRYIPVMLPGLDLYMVECNYHMDELMERRERKIREGKFLYEDNVLICHMSHETVTNWLKQNAGEHSEVVFLHQHIDNSKQGE